MFYRLFAKKTHPELRKVFESLSTYLNLDCKQWTIKQQIGTYQYPYSYVAQGQGLTISFYENALKMPTREETTEVVLTCENRPWFSFVASPVQQELYTRRHLDVSPLPQNTAWKPWELYTNNQELAESLLATTYQQLGIFKDLEAVEFVLERQRLYIKWSWLPNTPARQRQLRDTISFACSLIEALEQTTVATSGQNV